MKCVLRAEKAQKCVCGWGSAREPAGELTALPRPLDGFREGNEWEDKAGEDEMERKKGEIRKGQTPPEQKNSGYGHDLKCNVRVWCGNGECPHNISVEEGAAVLSAAERERIRRTDGRTVTRHAGQSTVSWINSSRSTLSRYFERHDQRLDDATS